MVVNFVYVFNKLFNGSYLEQTVDDVFLANTRPNSDWNVILDPFVIDRKSIKFKGETSSDRLERVSNNNVNVLGKPQHQHVAEYGCNGMTISSFKLIETDEYITIIILSFFIVFIVSTYHF